MKTNPFSLNPPNLWAMFADTHREALEKLVSLLEKGGVAVVEGPLGIGKTTLLERVSREIYKGLDKYRVPVVVKHLPCSLVRDEQMLMKMLLDSLLLDSSGETHVLISRLRDLSAKMRVVAMLDDLPPKKELAETARNLSDIHGFSVVMAGVPPSIRKLLSLSPSLRSRVERRIKLRRLTVREASDLLNKRAKQIGATVPEREVKRIWRAGKGIAREILKEASRRFEEGKLRLIPSTKRSKTSKMSKRSKTRAR
ncbi:MAG: AAA family ATPase [Candidatus Hadarchaeales archaeon]